MTKVAAYIDGFNTYFGMKHSYGRKYLWLDLVALVGHIRPKDEISVVRYFTAWVKDDPAGVVNQRQYVNALHARGGDRISVRLGRFKDRTLRPCRRCHQQYQCACPREYHSYEEKETDVAIGAAMVADTALGIGDITLLISADTDLIPAIEEVRHVDPNRPIYVAMPPGSRSPRFSALGVGLFNLPESALRAAQLPDVVADPATGAAYTRPAKWH